MRKLLRLFTPVLMFTCLFSMESAAQCTPPSGTAVNVDDCPTQTFQVQVDINTLGDAFSVGINYTVNGGPIIQMPGLALGTYFLGPFPIGDQIGVILEHDWNMACNVPLGTISGLCPIILIAPHCESFDNYSGSSCGSCTTLNPGIEVGGWTHTTNNQWQTCAGPTTSTNTGPSTDHTGAGNFIYCEATSPCFPNSVMTIQSPNYEISALTQPHITLWYYMYGTDLATASITIEVEDPAQSGFWIPVTTITELAVGGVNQWQFLNMDLNVTGPEIALRFTGTTGSNFGSDMALDDVCVVEAPNCTPPTASYTLIDDCANCSYTVEVNLTSLGDAPTVDLGSNLLGIEYPAVSSTGIYTMGPYFITDPSVAISIDHGVQPIFCSIDTVITTGCAATYCPGGPTSINDSQVESVTLNGNTQSIILANNCPGTLGVQKLYCSHVADIYQGLPYSIAIDFGSCSGNFTGQGQAWIDYDQNGVFDASESLGTVGPASPPGMVNWMFTVPAGAVVGNTVMRVMQQETSITPLNPCATYTFGSMIDFGIIVDPNPGCFPAFATATPTTDCANNNMLIDVDLTSLGDAAMVDINVSVNGGAPTTAQGGISSTGIYQIGPYLPTDTVFITIIHDSNALCNYNVGFVVSNSVTCVFCGTTPIMDSLCYGPNTDLLWRYQSSTSAPLAIIFDQGTIESFSFDKLTLYDGPDDTYPILYQNPTGTTQLAGLFFTTTGTTLTMTLTTDNTGNCSTSTTYLPWEWTVDCLDCTVPGGSYSVVPDCIHRNFMVEVDVDSTGSAATANLVNSLNNDTVFGAGIGVTLVGPFSMDTAVVISALNADNSLCRTNSLPLISFIDSCAIISCGIDYYNYCYLNNDDAWYTYQSTAGIPIAITFTGGNMLAGDKIIVYNGFDDFSAVIYNGNNGGNLAGLAVNSMNADSVITLRILSNATGSCDDGTVPNPLDWWVSCGMVGVEELSNNNDVHIYPNPATEQLFVSLPVENLTVTAEVFDATGRRVLSQQLSFNGRSDQPINVSDLQDGNYFLQIVTEEWYKAEMFVIAR